MVMFSPDNQKPKITDLHKRRVMIKEIDKRHQVRAEIFAEEEEVWL